MYLPKDVQGVIRSFANEHHVLTDREAFFTAVQTLRKVTRFITVRFRTAHMGYLLMGILRLLRLGRTGSCTITTGVYGKRSSSA